MAGGVRNLKWVLTGEDKSASRALEGVGKKAGEVHSKFGTLAAGLAGGAIGAGLVNFAKGSIAGFKDAEQSAAALQNAFVKFPKLADTNIGALQKLNSELERKTTFDDDALASGQAVLAQFGLTGKQLAGVTPLLADYAAKTGQDLPNAAKALGMAFSGNTRALKQVGINYKSTGDKGKDFANIQGLLNQKIGGFAESQGKTAAGQAEILKNQYGELQESVGARLVPALTKLAGVLLKVVDFVSRNQKVLMPLAAVIGTVVATVKVWNFVQAILNAELLANPIGLVVVAIAGLVVGLVYAYKHSETFRKIVQGAFSGIAAAAKAMWTVIRAVLKFVVDAYLGFYGAILNGAAKAFGWVPGIGPKLKAAAKEFDKFKNAVNNSLDGITEHKTITVDVASVAGGRSTDALGNAHGTYRPTAPARPLRVVPHGAAAVVLNHTTTLDGRVIARSTTSHQTRAVARGALPPGVA